MLNIQIVVGVLHLRKVNAKDILDLVVEIVQIIRYNFLLMFDYLTYGFINLINFSVGLLSIDALVLICHVLLLILF